MSNCPQCGQTLDGYDLCGECARPEYERQQQLTAAATELANAVEDCGRIGRVSVCDLATLQHIARRVLELAGETK